MCPYFQPIRFYKEFSVSNNETLSQGRGAHPHHIEMQKRSMTSKLKPRPPKDLFDNSRTRNAQLMLLRLMVVAVCAGS
jgi:hypothetical protein